MIENRIFTIVDALLSLSPEAEWNLIGNDYKDIHWISKDHTQPSQAEIEKEMARLQKEYDDLEYQRLRVREYPPMTDYLDGMVKDDQEQIQAYIDACLAVKEKYPKPKES